MKKLILAISAFVPAMWAGARAAGRAGGLAVAMKPLVCAAPDEDAPVRPADDDPHPGTS